LPASNTNATNSPVDIRFIFPPLKGYALTLEFLSLKKIIYAAPQQSSLRQ
jgi:hypothetical protein